MQYSDPSSSEWGDKEKGGISDPIVNLLSNNYDVDGDKNEVKIFPVLPRTPPLLLPSLHNPRVCGDVTSERW